jgi:putative mRNA 3-end processing factor
MYRLQAAGGHGIHLPGCGLSLDNSHPDAEWVFVSHAHADHLPRDRRCKVIATRATHAFMTMRGFRGECVELGFGESLDLARCRVTLFPAGHILGSAMILVEGDEGRLLYTGDTRTPPSPASEGFQLPDSVDELIIEATFGLPIYRWKCHEEIAEELRQFAVEALESGATPLFMGYNLGKAQEIMHLLAPLDHPMQIHGGGFPYCGVYEREGIPLGRYSAYERASCEGSILIAPSSAPGSGFASHLKKLRTAYCSGWAHLESRRAQMNLDAGFALSDHLDFFELLEACRTLAPRKIHITHTPNPDVLEHYLRKEGFDASFLNLRLAEEAEQGDG